MRLRVRTKDGKVDKDSLEREVKKKIPGFSEYEFDYQEEMLFVKARKPEMAEGMVELFVIWFYR